MACELVLQQNALYGKVTCLQVRATSITLSLGSNVRLRKVADAAQDKEFIATPCCVKAMENIWYDKIQPYGWSTGNLVAMVVSLASLGFLAPFVYRFRHNKVDL